MDLQSLNQLTISGSTFYEIPDLPEYYINKSGKIWNHKKLRLVGSWYQFSGPKSQIYAISDILIKIFGTSKRDTYILPEFRKKSAQMPKNEVIFHKHKEQFKTVNEFKTDLLNKWYSVSGNTAQWGNYLQGRGLTVDLVVAKINTTLGCEGCINVLNYDNLEIDWDGLISSDWTSLITILWFWNRFVDKCGNYSVKWKLYPDEYKLWAQIVMNLFKLNVYNDKFHLQYDVSDEVREHKMNLNSSTHSLVNHKIKQKSNDKEEEDDFKFDFHKFESNDPEYIELDKFVFENVKMRNEERDYQLKVNNKAFVNDWETLVERNNGKYPISHLFVEYSNIFFKDLFFGFKRLSHKYQMDILKEIQNNT